MYVSSALKYQINSHVKDIYVNNILLYGILYCLIFVSSCRKTGGKYRVDVRNENSLRVIIPT